MKSKSQAQDIASLEQLRDELKIQAHLFKAQLRDEWHKVEKDMARLQRELRPVQKAAEKSATEVSAASELLFQSVKEGYQRIKRSLVS